MKYYWREFLHQFSQLDLEQKINFWAIVILLIAALIMFVIVEVT